MNNSTAVSLTLPSLTSDSRQQLLQEQPLVNLYEVFATIADPRSKEIAATMDHRIVGMRSDVSCSAANSTPRISISTG